MDVSTVKALAGPQEPKPLAQVAPGEVDGRRVMALPGMVQTLGRTRDNPHLPYMHEPDSVVYTFFGLLSGVYGVFAGTWNFAPGSKSCSLRGTDASPQGERRARGGRADRSGRARQCGSNRPRREGRS